MSRVLPLVLLVVAACVPSAETTTTAATAPTTTSSSQPEETTTTQVGELPPCLAGDTRFVEDGSAGVLTQLPGDAASVGTVTWHDYGPCERLVIDYRTTEGAPAVDPPTVATLLVRSSGVLRLNLDMAVTASGFEEQVVDSDLVAGVFAVENPGRTIFLDIHLATAAVARVSNASSPARTVIDLRGGGPELAGTPLRSGQTIVVEPLTGEVAYPFSVGGYTLRSGDEVVATLTGEGASLETSANIADRYDTWGSFTLLFTDGPAGPITVAIDGIELELTARR